MFSLSILKPHLHLQHTGLAIEEVTIGTQAEPDCCVCVCLRGHVRNFKSRISLGLPRISLEAPEYS